MQTVQFAVLVLLGVICALLLCILARGQSVCAANVRNGKTRTIGILSAPMALSEEAMLAVRDRIEKSIQCGARAFVVDKGMDFKFVEVYDDDHCITTTTNPA